MALNASLLTSSQLNSENSDDSIFETLSLKINDKNHPLFVAKKHTSLKLGNEGLTTATTTTTPERYSHSDKSPRMFEASKTKSVESTPVFRPHIARGQKLNTLRSTFKSSFFGEDTDVSKKVTEEKLLIGDSFQKDCAAQEMGFKTNEEMICDSESAASIEITRQESEDFVFPKRKIFKSLCMLNFEEFKELSDDHPNIHNLISQITEYFQILGRLGEGTSAVVKKCIRIADKKPFAMKIINFRGDQELLVQISNEFKNHQKLDHPNIIKVHDLFIDMQEKRIYMLMDLVDGQDILSLVTEQGPFSGSINPLTTRWPPRR